MATVDVVFTGYVGERVAGTVSLVRDQGMVAVVDPGMVPDRAVILDPLYHLGVAPEDVTDVIISHHHPDHTMHIALFPNARLHDHWAIYAGDLWTSRPAEGAILGPEVRLTATEVTIRAQDVDGGAHLACHPRAVERGTWVIDPTHWDGLPDGRTRATTIDVGDLDRVRRRRNGSLEVTPHVARALSIPVGVRPLADYATAAGMGASR